MKIYKTLLRVLKILIGLHEYANQKKREQEECSCKCCTDKDGENNAHKL